MNRARSSGPLAVLVLAAVFAVAACGSTAPPNGPTSVASAPPAAATSGSPADPGTPVASPGSAASPAAAGSLPPATGADVVAPFLATISEPGFAASSAVTGSLVVGGVTSPVSGTYDLDGSDYARALKIGAGSKVAAQALKVASNTAYSATGDGPWFEAPFPAAGTDLGSFLRSIKAVEDKGVETKNGRQLHHLVATDVSLPPAVLGLTDPSITGTTGTVDFWVSDDGKPQVVAVSDAWTQKSGKDPAAAATMAVEFALSNVGGSVGVTAPEQVWKPVKSKKYKYTMAYPSDWEFKKAKSTKKVDWFIGPEYASVGASNYKTLGMSLNEWTKTYLKYTPKLSGVKGFKLQSNKAATLDGAKARRLEYKEKYKGDQEYWIDVLAVHGGKIYEVAYVSSKPLTKADRELFDQFLATFHF